MNDVNPQSSPAFRRCNCIYYLLVAEENLIKHLDDVIGFTTVSICLVFIFIAIRKYGFFKEGAGPWLILAGICFDLSMIDDIIIVIDQILGFNTIPEDLFDFYNEYVDIFFIFIAGIAITRGIYLQFITTEQMNEQLSQNITDFRILNNQVPIGIFTYDINGAILNINSAAVKMLGSPSEDATKNINLFNFSPLIQAGLAHDMRKCVNKKVEIVSEKNYTTKWGKEVCLRYKLVPIVDDEGTLVYAICTFEDILKEKEIENLKGELQQRKNDFVSMMNHELRTPVSVLQGYLTFLKMSPDLPSNDRDTIFNALIKNINRLERLIVDSQTMTHLQKEIFKINKEKTNLESFFSTLAESYATRLKHQIQFEFDACNSLEVEIDPDRIQQVIDNLLDNAIKHTSPEDRQIVLSCELNGSSLEIHITDNGSGIKHQDKERIFEQFVSIPSKYCIKGTGIGLYISREIINTHGGTLTVFSEGEDKGSVFTIKLPIN